MPEYDIEQLISNEQYMKNNHEKQEHRSLPYGTPDVTEKVMIEDTLTECRGNVTLAARELGVSRNTLYKKVSKYGIKIERK